MDKYDDKPKRGRPFSGYIIKTVKIAVLSEAEYQRYMATSTSRSRVEIVLREVKQDDKQ